MDWKLKKMSPEKAVQILEELVRDLAGIAPEDMTTCELNILRKCCEPNEDIARLPLRGVEEQYI